VRASAWTAGSELQTSGAVSSSLADALLAIEQRRGARSSWCNDRICDARDHEGRPVRFRIGGRRNTNQTAGTDAILHIAGVSDAPLDSSAK